MGCDIHLNVEKKVGGKWVCINPLHYSNYNNYEKPLDSEIFDDRNYELFGFLAQVRTEQKNGFEPKGLPEDVSVKVREKYSKWGWDAHSTSYLTLKELKEKFKGNVLVEGMMPKKQWKIFEKEFKEGNYKNLYPHCGWTNKSGYVDFSVEIPVEYQFSRFKEKVIDWMQEHTWDKATKEHDETTVRIVFWFDN